MLEGIGTIWLRGQAALPAFIARVGLLFRGPWQMPMRAPADLRMMLRPIQEEHRMKHFRTHFFTSVPIAPEQGAPPTGARRTAYVFLRYRSADVILAIWAITVLLIAAHASFGAQPTFLGSFDVSVAPF
jgi:hypothetical protein